MSMKDKMFHFMEHYNNPFLVGTFPENELIYCNKSAKTQYDMTDKENILAVLRAIFLNNNISMKSVLETEFRKEDTAIFQNVHTKKADGSKQLTTVMIGFFNEEKTEVYVEIIPQTDSRMENAIEQVNLAVKPKAILNFDEKLSIIHCNEPFHKVFESNEELRHSHFDNHLLNGFRPEQRAKLISDIHSKLSVSPSYSTKIKVYPATGEERWYLLELEKRTLDFSGSDKILAYMTNIEKQIELETENSQMNQYFTALQELTPDALFRVEMPSQTLHHTHTKGLGEKYGLVIPNHVQTFIKDQIIHPEDSEKYLAQLRQLVSAEGQISEVPLRGRFQSDDYQWYIIKGKKILDNEGNLLEVIGVIVNIEEKHSMEEQYSVLNQYFMAMQELTVDKLFHIDIKTKTFTHNDENAMDFGVPTEIPDYVNYMISNNLVHPEDQKRYLAYTDDLFSGINREIKVRSAVDIGVYEWFHIKSRYIKDASGNNVEVFGKLENIQQQRDLELRASRDPMTDVLNKMSYQQEVTRVLEISTNDHQHALIFIDIDDFKSVNDENGHSFGDFLLTTVTMRLKKMVRATDSVGRIGGDEFSVFLKDVGNEQSVVERANLFLESLNREFSFEGKTGRVNASVGIALFPHHGLDFEELYKKADKAMYRSKEEGKNNVRLFV